jgi:hypothetical protein
LFWVQSLPLPIVTLLLGLVTNAASDDPRWPGILDILRSRPWESFGVLTVVAVALALAALLVDRPKASSSLTKIADQLAIAVESQWSREARWRGLYNPYTLPVRWVGADARLVMGWDALCELTTCQG